MSLTILTLNLFLLSVAGFLRALPILIPLLIQLLGVFLQISTRVYRALFTRLAPPVAAWTGIDLWQDVPRATLVILLSLSGGLLLIWLFSLPLDWLTLGLVVSHGIGVLVMWNQMPDREGITTGVKIPWEH